MRQKSRTGSRKPTTCSSTPEHRAQMTFLFFCYHNAYESRRQSHNISLNSFSIYMFYIQRPQPEAHYRRPVASPPSSSTAQRPGPPQIKSYCLHLNFNARRLWAAVAADLLFSPTGNSSFLLCFFGSPLPLTSSLLHAACHPSPSTCFSSWRPALLCVLDGPFFSTLKQLS